MRILIDPEIFFYGPCGMVRYYSAVCHALGNMGCKLDIPLLVSYSDFISGRVQAMDRCRAVLPGWLFTKLIDHTSKRIYFKKLIRGGYDAVVVTSPVFEDTFLNYSGSTPFLMVVHDTMRCIPGPDGFFDSAGGNVDRLAYLARRASEVICVSEATQRDLIALCGSNKINTTVIHSGNLLDASARMPAKRLPEKYLLFVGERSGRKNFRFLAHAISRLLKRHENIRLICTGKFNPWEKDLFASLEISKQLMDIDVTDGELVYLYQHALCLIYPSLYEGFGLPVLEAMVNGCPVVTADSGSIREVAGDAVEYIDPASHKSISERVEAIIGDAGLRKRLTELGLKRAQLFPKERMMQALLERISVMKKKSKRDINT